MDLDQDFAGDLPALKRVMPNAKDGDEYFFGGNPGRSWKFENGEWKLKELWSVVEWPS
jgi:hypothetical protein